MRWTVPGRVSPVMMTSTEVEEEGGLSQNTSIMTVPSVENKGYPGNSTSRNFTITTNPIVLEAPTVDGGATQPGVMDDDRPAQGVEEEPSQGVARSSQTQIRCVHNKKGVCADHGPVAKWKIEIQHNMLCRLYSMCLLSHLMTCILIC